MGKFLGKLEYADGPKKTTLDIMIEVLAELKSFNAKLDALADALASLTCAGRLKMSPGEAWEALTLRRKE